MRDPRVDPKAGDIIQPQQYRGFPLPAKLTVHTVLGDLLAVLREGDVFWVTLDHWRHVYRNAEVINAAD